MATPQYFKGDEIELQMDACAAEPADSIEMQLDDFFEGAYTSFPLGDVIYDTGRSPLSNAINRDIFRSSFPEIFESFVMAGNFDSYLAVFNKIFGEEVEVDFTIPDPGKLNIDILADEVELSNFISRTIENNEYNYDEMVTQDDDQIVFQSIKGFKSQYELEQMLFEMVPAGIFTTITLDLA